MDGVGEKGRRWVLIATAGYRKAWKRTMMLEFSLGSFKLWVWWCVTVMGALVLFAGQSKREGRGKRGAEAVERAGRLQCQGRWQGMAKELVAGARKDDGVVGCRGSGRPVSGLGESGKTVGREGDRWQGSK